ncbi:MAG: DUF418 domain-containing protein [Cyclobacteriaceae bacterium]|nr:DUF418 domain-containing protein [Cyclobacteriaceae bacterium]
MTAFNPVSQSSRIIALDVLRGVALLGILLMNIPGFSMAEYSTEAFKSNPNDLNFWVRGVVNTVFEGKMRALFSAIFGAGIILFTINKERGGESATALFYRRMAWLVVFGLIHSHILLWAGEILYYYGVIGMIAFIFRKMKPVYLVMAIPLVAIVEFVANTIFFQDIREKRIAYVEAMGAQKNNQELTVEQTKALAEWRDIEVSLIPNKEDAAEHTRLMKGDYASVASYVRRISWDGQTTYLIYGLWDPLALMLLGIALFKWGFLTLEWTRSQYIKTIIIGYGLGFPLSLWYFYYNYHTFPTLEASLNHIEVTPIEWMNLIYPTQRILLMMGHAALVLVFIQSHWVPWLLDRLRAVGQMAFTNYIVHTVICTLIFFGYGLNYYAELEYYQIYFVVAAIWILQILYSKPWLNRYLFGPLEWLWRSLTYWKIQPMRREKTNH